jgi:methyltransferase (TIGR00027 family)
MDRTSTEVADSDPSRTSIVVAALRAFGAREPDPSVRNPDFLAQRLITPAELQLVQAHPIARALGKDYETGRKDREVSGMSNLMLIRTRFIDDHLVSALKDGARQLVILGAGFDTRPYRFAELLKDKTVFEVDRRSTQRIKKQRLTDASIAVPPNVRFIEIDFKKDALRDVLINAGYQPAEKAFFIWEGVSMYLREPDVRETLRTITAIAAPGSAVAMDIVNQAMLDLLEKLPYLPQHNYTTHWGEPWTFAVPDQAERAFFRECGLDLREVLSFFGKEVVRRYLTRSNGSKFGSVTGGMPEHHKFYTMVRMLQMFLTRRSRWYSVAKLDVPPQS